MSWPAAKPGGVSGKLGCGAIHDGNGSGGGAVCGACGPQGPGGTVDGCPQGHGVGAGGGAPQTGKGAVGGPIGDGSEGAAGSPGPMLGAGMGMTGDATLDQLLATAVDAADGERTFLLFLPAIVRGMRGWQLTTRLVCFGCGRNMALHHMGVAMRRTTGQLHCTTHMEACMRHAT